MQNSCKTIIENIEKVDHFDDMKSWKFGGIFTFDIESKKLKFWPLIIKNNFKGELKLINSEKGLKFIITLDSY